jgi:hypothetical protein
LIDYVVDVGECKLVTSPCVWYEKAAEFDRKVEFDDRARIRDGDWWWCRHYSNLVMVPTEYEHFQPLSCPIERGISLLDQMDLSPNSKKKTIAAFVWFALNHKNRTSLRDFLVATSVFVNDHPTPTTAIEHAPDAATITQLIFCWNTRVHRVDRLGRIATFVR